MQMVGERSIRNTFYAIHMWVVYVRNNTLSLAFPTHLQHTAPQFCSHKPPPQTHIVIQPLFPPLHNLMLFSIIIYIVLVAATPPACFLSCINEVARSCPYEHRDLRCLCLNKDSVFGCMIDICPWGNFDAGRDHFLGTCLEHRAEVDDRWTVQDVHPPHFEPAQSPIPNPTTRFSPTNADITIDLHAPAASRRLFIVKQEKGNPNSRETIFDLRRLRNVVPSAVAEKIDL